MITLFYYLSKSKLSKSVDISKYYRDIDELEPLTLRCGCGRVGSLIKHGRYQRDIIINDIVYEMKIQRVYCKHCGRTHAILPVFIIPFERQTLPYVLELVDYSLKREINKADYELVRWTGIFRAWQNRLRGYLDIFSDDVSKIITFCASTYKMMFMQSKKRCNLKLNEVDLFLVPLPT